MVMPPSSWASNASEVSAASLRVAEVSAKAGAGSEDKIQSDVQTQAVHEKFLLSTGGISESEAAVIIKKPIEMEGAATISTANQRLSFKWNQPEGSSQFQIQLADLTRNIPRYYYQTTDKNHFEVPDEVAFGKYRFWVRAQYKDGEWGEWSAGQTIIVDEKQAAVPPKNFSDPAKVSPQEAVKWDPVKHAVSYEVWIGKVEKDGRLTRVSGARNILETYYEFPEDLVSGDYAVWIRGIFESGDGVWGEHLKFHLDQSLALDTKIKITTYSDINGFSVLEWFPVENVTAYDIRLRNQATGEETLIENHQSNQILLDPQSVPTSFLVEVRGVKRSGKKTNWSVGTQFSVPGQALAVPALHYRFDEPAGKVVTNQAGKNTESAQCSPVNNPPGRSTAGVEGSAASFQQGLKQGYRCGLPNSFSTSNAWSASGWFKTDSKSGDETFEIFGNMDYLSGFSIRIDSTGSVEASLRNNRTDYSSLLKSQSGYRDEKWHYAALSFDASEKSLVLYLDGERVGKTVWPYGELNLPGTMSVGMLPNFSRYYVGEIDEVKVYNRALSDEESAREFRTYSRSIAVKPENQIILDYPAETPKLQFTNYNPRVISSVLIRIEARRQGSSAVMVREMTLAPFEFQKIMELGFSEGEGFYDVRIQYLHPGTRESVLSEENVSFFIRPKTAVKELLYVSFTTPTINQLKDEHLRAFKDSPYSGLAVAIHDVYGVQAPGVEDFREQLDKLKSDESKSVWPWVFTNIMYGTPDKVLCENCQTHCAPKAGGGLCSPSDVENYYSKIRGVDIYDEMGGLTKYLKILETALQAAQETRAPGIVVDSEFYNNYGANSVDYLASLYGKPVKEIEAQLERVGAQIADLVDAIYPQAVLLYMTTALDAPQSVSAVLFRAMLKRAKLKNYIFTLVEGGETRGYLHDSKNSISDTYGSRYVQSIKDLQTYPNFKLGGTNAPFSDYKKTSGWVRSFLDKMESPPKNIAEHETLLKYLFQTNEYVWIYGAGAASYNMFRKSDADIFNPVISSALEGHTPGFLSQPNMKINSGVTVTKDRKILVSLTGLSGEVAAVSYAVNSRDEGAFSRPVPVAQNAKLLEIMLPSSYGMNTVYVRLHDKEGKVIQWLLQRIELEKTVEWVMNGGAPVTLNQTVETTLKNLPPGVASISYAVNSNEASAFSAAKKVSKGAYSGTLRLTKYGANIIYLRLLRADGSVIRWITESIEWKDPARLK